MEARDDILVYTSEPFKERPRAERPDHADALRVVRREGHRLHGQGASTSTRTARAYNLDESIQRMRYRDGYDKPLVWMEQGKVYKVTLQPLTTSNYFAPGPPPAHRGVEQQLPALRPQPEHRRQQLRRIRRARRAQRRPPLEAVPVAGHGDRREADTHDQGALSHFTS